MTAEPLDIREIEDRHRTAHGAVWGGAVMVGPEPTGISMEEALDYAAKSLADIPRLLDHVRELTAERDRLRDAVAAVASEPSRLEAARRIRVLHQDHAVAQLRPTDDMDGFCITCSTSWPCATVRLADYLDPDGEA